MRGDELYFMSEFVECVLEEIGRDYRKQKSSQAIRFKDTDEDDIAFTVFSDHPLAFQIPTSLVVSESS